MTFEEAVAEHSSVVDGEIVAFVGARKNPRLEKADLRQEALLKLWERWPQWQKAANMGAYCRQVVRNALKDYDRRFRRDALYRAENRGLEVCHA